MEGLIVMVQLANSGVYKCIGEPLVFMVRASKPDPAYLQVRLCTPGHDREPGVSSNHPQLTTYVPLDSLMECGLELYNVSFCWQFTSFCARLSVRNIELS
jgi:hypothetical protein